MHHAACRRLILAKAPGSVIHSTLPVMSIPRMFLHATRMASHGYPPTSPFAGRVGVTSVCCMHPCMMPCFHCAPSKRQASRKAFRKTFTLLISDSLGGNVKHLKTCAAASYKLLAQKQTCIGCADEPKAELLLNITQPKRILPARRTSSGMSRIPIDGIMTNECTKKP